MLREPFGRKRRVGRPRVAASRPRRAAAESRVSPTAGRDRRG